MAEEGENSKKADKSSEEGKLLLSGLPFAESYSVDFATRLPQFDTHGGIAFAAKLSMNTTKSIYALVHNTEVPMRDRVTERLLKKTIKNYNNLIEQGELPVTLEGKESTRLVSIVERPMGPSLDSPEGRARVNPHLLIHVFIKSILIALAELHGNKIIHRAINPANIYFADVQGNDLVLGECFSSPAGSMQPSSFEVISRADCHPMGRGIGGEEDDMFAFGCSIITLAVGAPLKNAGGSSDEFTTRIEKTSYRFLKENHKIPDGLEGIIRGLMSEDGGHRWGLNEIAQFVDGHVSRLIAGNNFTGLSKPVSFNGHNYTDRRSLAHAMGSDLPQTVNYFAEIDFGAWVAANLTSEILSEKAEDLLVSGKSDSSGAAPMVSRICAFLDPHGPLRYNGFSFSFDGVGSMIAAAYQDKTGNMLSSLLEFLSSNQVSDYTKIVGEVNEVVQESAGQIIWGASFLKSNKLGMGMERLLYEFNPRLPCQGEKFKNAWVDDARAALLQLDRVIGQTGSSSDLLDAHVTAFCSAKVKGLEQMFGILPNGDLPTGLNASRFIDTVGSIQLKAQTGPLPNLCKKLCEGLRPVVKAIHYKPRREMLAKRLDKLTSGGSLADVSTHLKLGQHRAADEQEFSRACQAFTQLERVRKGSKLQIKPSDKRAVFKGYNAMSIVGLLVLIASVIMTTIGI